MNIPFGQLACFSVQLILFLAASSAHGQAGALDTSFDGDGIATLALGSSLDEGEAVVVQPDGKIVVAGFTGDSTLVDFAVMRYDPDGSLDATFGNGGVVITDIDSSYQAAVDVALDSDGRILVCGWTLVADGSLDMAVVRYLTDGTLDSSFGNGGVVTTAAGGLGDSEQAYAIAVQQDGRIVVVGAAAEFAMDRFCVVRYLPDGTLDPSFSGDGIQITPMVPTWPGLAHGLAIQPDGKIVAVGWSYGFALARYTTDGDLDPTFGINGTVTSGVQGLAYDVALQPDGKILMVGSVGAGTFSCVTARYNPDGSLDSGFGTNGKVITMVDMNSVADAVLVQPDGKIIVSGYAGLGFLVMRYGTSGTLDASFGSGGIVTTAIGSWGAISFGSARQTDGRIVLCGRTTDGPDTDIAVARYLPDLEIGVLDLEHMSVATLIYPNPIGAEALLEFELNTSMALTCLLQDAEGRTTRTFFAHASHAVGEHREVLDLSGLAAGHYTVVLGAGGRSVSVRVVKQ